MIGVILVPAMGVLGWAAYSDAKWRRIPNEVSIGVAALGALRIILDGDMAAAVRSLGVCAIVLAVSFLLFARGIFGGGDAKLISGATLLVGSTRVLDFLLITSVIGALLVPVVLIVGRYGAPDRAGSEGELAPRSPGEVPKPPRPTVPYGVAIAVACAVILVMEYRAK